MFMQVCAVNKGIAINYLWRLILFATRIYYGLVWGEDMQVCSGYDSRASFVDKDFSDCGEE
jgi:hypothetical protein